MLPWIKPITFILCCAPAADLAWGFYSDNLGINPLERLIHDSGRWSLILLIATLSITPLRRLLNTLVIQIRFRHGKRLSDWNWLIRLRRMLGLFVFFYAGLHLAVYLILDQDLDLEYILLDIKDRPFIMLGMLCFILLTPLAATSNKWSMKRLGKKWLYLHKLTYPIAIGAVLHYWWLSKVGVYDPLPYSLALAVLLGYRALLYLGLLRSTAADGDGEAPNRATSPVNS